VAVRYGRPASIPILAAPFTEELAMLRWALIFFVISLVAGVFGFTGIAEGARSIAKALFFIAIALFVVFVILAVTVTSSV
jgi:uncharacterized membrane protein YtjA (UPF0391 family)